MMTNNKRIAKNTILLYFRMLFLMLVNLYTSRVILRILGVEDYGIYNAVGGIVLMLSFLNSALSNGSSRFITFELGKKNNLQLNNVFCTVLNSHILLSVLVVIISETVGLWFVINKDQGANSTKKALENWYNIEIVEKSKGFLVFRAKIS